MVRATCSPIRPRTSPGSDRTPPCQVMPDRANCRRRETLPSPSVRRYSPGTSHVLDLRIRRPGVRIPPSAQGNAGLGVHGTTGGTTSARRRPGPSIGRSRTSYDRSPARSPPLKAISESLGIPGVLSDSDQPALVALNVEEAAALGISGTACYELDMSGELRSFKSDADATISGPWGARDLLPRSRPLRAARCRPHQRSASSPPSHGAPP